MKIICAWCNRVIGGRGSDLSHGICKRCFDDLLQAQFDFMTVLPTSPPLPRPARRTTGAQVPPKRDPRVQPAFAGF